MLQDLWTTYSNLSQLTTQEQVKPIVPNPNPNLYPLPNLYLTYIVCPQILQHIIIVGELAEETLPRYCFCRHLVGVVDINPCFIVTL